MAAEIGNHQIEAFSNPPTASSSRNTLCHVFHDFHVSLRLGLTMPYLIIHSLSTLSPLTNSPVSEPSLSTCHRRAAIAGLPEKQSGVAVPFRIPPRLDHLAKHHSTTRHVQALLGQYGYSHRTDTTSHQLTAPPVSRTNDRSPLDFFFLISLLGGSDSSTPPAEWHNRAPRRSPVMVGELSPGN